MFKTAKNAETFNERKRARQLARKVRKWLATPEGNRGLNEAAERAVEVTEELGRARIISDSDLHKPFTI